jgi:hypothetical protein
MIPAPLPRHPGSRRTRRGTVALLGAVAFAATACTSHTGTQAAGAATGSTSAASPTASPTVSPRTASTGASSAASPVATIAPAPHGGNVHRHVPSGVAHSAAPVPLSHPAHFGRGLSVRVVKHATVQAKADGPGQISGPATALTIRFTNASRRTIDLSSVVVADHDAQDTPLLSVSARPGRAVTGSLGPHASKSGVYVFTLPQRRHNPYTISISYSTTAPVVRLVGDAA